MHGESGVSVYIDDIILTGASDEEHRGTLDKVLERLELAGLRLKAEKCVFMQPRVVYLGHVIDEQGLHPTEDKVKAIRDAPSPKNVTELKGLINYYSKFLENLSSKLSPLYVLLRKNTKWHWGKEQQEAFQAAKEALQKDSFLTHFDPAKRLVLACDASNYVLGAVLCHEMDDSQERPVAFVPRTMNVAEKKYSQLEKEAFAVVFGVKKFHTYLYGRSFRLESDHQPLSYFIEENSTDGIISHTEVGIDTCTLPVYHLLQTWKEAEQC